ncbi:MAG TPA: 23S rRNA (guanosine(2251)-2'-O)-methyltransferase RlmB [Syntrophales bacterium]|nr:23S rRNA (guanosine(2251)-2'-O)-methyltransferase RlmB [Syntrophales bacterium]HOX94138.1 23S rRNA (guanosine(2251)-2'-O)-methyltransferase RlmB [Syntrophales bacterium]HPI57358.1 23S rRNA (guanosine(2251)-2'-O)-methyltransferase RlmB [Syntrophales bacterium]HPN25422.1 23S rRNA (guanosine(2251)-2'-O)-methyltransferase RlmB [Syntrophales bacterium]HQM29904.1 23S rRNA (guanosine(2251)-2'-O)-methyltransferase RlmB [Syntrophales bacterium]
MQVIYGINPVTEMLQGGAKGVQRIVVAGTRGGEDMKVLLGLAARAGVPVEYRDRAYLEKLAGTGNHQGAVCLCRDFEYAGLDDLVSNRREPFVEGLIVILDGVTDPQNLGALLRTARCFGANGVVIPQDRASPVTPAVVKASAGAALHLPVARVVNLANTLERLKKEGYWIYGAEARSGTDLEKVNFGGAVALVMGSEGKGIRPLVRKKCDFFVSIPLPGNFESLNVSVAAGIILHQIDLGRKRS